MKKIIIALIVLTSLSFVSAHTGDAEAPAGINETMWDEMQEHHEAMHSTYGNEFYCDAEGCASGNMTDMMGGQNMMSGMGYGMFGGFGFIVPILLVILLIILIIYFSLKIIKEIKKK